MMTDYIILFLYIIAARWVIKKTKTYWLRNIIGPFLGGIMISLMLTGVVQDNFQSLVIVAPAFIHFMYISGKRINENGKNL